MYAANAVTFVTILFRTSGNRKPEDIFNRITTLLHCYLRLMSLAIDLDNDDSFWATQCALRFCSTHV